MVFLAYSWGLTISIYTGISIGADDDQELELVLNDDVMMMMMMKLRKSRWRMSDSHLIIQDASSLAKSRNVSAWGAAGGWDGASLERLNFHYY